MAKTILCILALVVASLAYPADVAPKLPEKTQVVAQLEVHPAEVPIPEKQPVQEPVKTVEHVVIPTEAIQDEIQQRVQEEVQEAQQEAEIYSEPQVPLEEVPPGAVVPDLAPDANPEEDKSDLEGANTFWGGWGRRWGGWGGGWGGGYYYPRRSYGWGHGYGRGYGHGYGRGYGGWRKYYW